MRRPGTGAGSIIALLAVSAAALLTMGSGSKPPSVDLTRFNAEVERELPTGASVGAVVAFLEARGLPHSGLVSPEHAIYSQVRILNSSQPGFTPTRAQLQFWFTADGTLVKFAVREYDPSLN